MSLAIHGWGEVREGLSLSGSRCEVPVLTRHWEEWLSARFRYLTKIREEYERELIPISIVDFASAVAVVRILFSCFIVSSLSRYYTICHFAFRHFCATVLLSVPHVSRHNYSACFT